MSTLSVVIPVYNEVNTLAEILRAVRESGVEQLQIIVVDDASSDGTFELIRNELASKIDIVVHHETNQGKGAALKTGIKHADGQLIVFQDADLEYDPQNFSHMLAAMAHEQADAVYGSRYLDRAFGESSPAWHQLINAGLTLLSNLFTGYRLTDMETCYKMFPASFLKKITLEEKGFSIEPEMTAKAAASGLRLVEVPVSYARRTFDEGKKIGLKDGFEAVYTIFKYGFRYL